MDTSGARQLWQAADAKGVTCRYCDVPKGTYAVSIGHDLNGNKRVDTNRCERWHRTSGRHVLGG